MNLPSSFLLTVHGSAVWFDEQTNTLRHGPVEATPRTLRIENRFGRDALIAATPSGPAAIDGLRPDGRLGRSPGGAPLTLRRHQLQDGLFALEANGIFLCAEADGTLSLTRSQQGAWEVFAPVDETDLDWLAELVRRAWLSASHDTVLPAGSIRPTTGFTVQVGQITIGLAEVLAARPAATARHDITLHYDGWKVERLSPWRPLVYLTAFGADDVFERLSLALQSLRQFGRYDGEILLFTDRMPEQLGGAVPPGMERQITLATAPARDSLDHAAAKYRIHDIPALAAHRPLLYLAPDVLCDQPIGGLLRAIHRADRLCLALEDDLLGTHNLYGANLFAADQTARPRNERGATAGLIGIPDIHLARRSFPVVLSCLYALARGTGTRQPLEWYDQPVLNYVLHKTDAAAFDVLTPRVVPQVDPAVSPSGTRRLGFAHFGGDAGDRLAAMRGYLAWLRQNG
ncbi:hypothetical protein [Rhodopila sp.]|jgi:hypothetical protein|uniref:hypothetical protein n=1 Tax=Rhodopila sp. TaxID=2480087 RepID=UPI002CA63054|nr:hypothetical protein [Rhodopila sp.]HVZ08802.1 hypothetical protein [Rhodopila sp.]